MSKLEYRVASSRPRHRLSTTIAALNIVTTVVVMRTKRMTWGRLPVFVWGVILSVILGLTAFPAFFVSQIMVLMDRVFQTSWYIRIGQRACKSSCPDDWQARVAVPPLGLTDTRRLPCLLLLPERSMVEPLRCERP